MTIFADTAPRYWACGLSVIPLMSSEKRPAIQSWQTYGKRMSTPEEQDFWLKDYANCNIGLPTGVQSGVVIIDIDSKDPAVLALLDKILPKSPWVRIGAKGMALAYRYNGEVSFNLRGIDGMILELLSTGRQLAIPPSIDPDAKRPYTANCDLVDVLSILPILPPDVEVILRAALASHGIKAFVRGAIKIAEFVPAGYRDSEMVAHAGVIARDITRGQRTVVEGIREMHHWVETYVEKVAGDELEPIKAQTKLIEFLIRDVTHGRRALPSGWDAELTPEDKEALGLTFTSDQELWSVDQIQNYLFEEFQRFTDNTSVGFRGVVDVALSKMAANLDLSPLDERRLLNFIADQGGTNTPLATLRQELADRRKGNMSGTDHTEIAEAVLDDLGQTGEIRFDALKFWKWMGAFWKVLSDVEIKKHIALNYSKLPASKFDNQQGQVLNQCRTLAAKDLCLIKTTALNFANGMLTEDLELLPHQADYGMTYYLPYRYMPEEAGKCSIFFQFLHDCWGTDADFQEKVDALQEMMAATMFGAAPTYQRAFCLYGASTGPG